MDELNSITGVVQHVLEVNPDTRNNDALLYIEVCKILNPRVLKATFETGILNLKYYGVPNQETVGRVRRKVVECHSELAPVEAVKGGRWSREKMFHEYAAETV